jgi:GH35 family endo-1,4-beta-xylanase
MLQLKNIFNLTNNNFGVFNQIKVHYGYYEIAKNCSLHIHTLLWFNDFTNPNTFVQTLLDDESFQQNMINYLNDIITQEINQYKSCPITKI